jgi:hypothetical protein
MGDAADKLVIGYPSEDAGADDQTDQDLPDHGRLPNSGLDKIACQGDEQQ